MPDAIDAAAPPDEPPQVIVLPVQRIVGEPAHRELRRVGHPDDDRAGLLQIGRHRRVSRRDIVLEGHDAVGIGLTLDVDVYLDGDGHALELARRGALRQRSVGGAGRFDRLRAEIDHDGVDRGVGGVHPVDMGLNDLFGGRESVANCGCRINSGPLPDRRCHFFSSPAKTWRKSTRAGSG